MFDRRGKANPTIAAEIGFLGALWTLWTGIPFPSMPLQPPLLMMSPPVTLGYAGSHNCDYDALFFSDSLSCAETRSSFVFALLIWLILLAYLCTRTTFIFIAKNRGNHGIWRLGVSQADFYHAGGYDRVARSDEDTDTEFFLLDKHDTSTQPPA